MTTPINSTSPYERFKIMVDHLINGKPQPKPSVKPEEEEPEWSSRSRSIIQSSGNQIFNPNYQK